MKAPTDNQIRKEIAKLREIKPDIRETSAFGDNHHDSIDAQIEVLEDILGASEFTLDESALCDYAEEQGWADNVRDGAIGAHQWATGNSEDGKPSDNWKPLVIKAESS